MTEKPTQNNEASVTLHLGEANIPTENKGNTFENFQAKTSEQTQALILCEKLVENKAQKPAGLILSGAPGNGKTHLAVEYTMHFLREVYRLFSTDFRAVVFLILSQHCQMQKNTGA